MPLLLQHGLRALWELSDFPSFLHELPWFCPDCGSVFLQVTPATAAGRDGMYPKNDGFCIENHGFCIEHDEFCIEHDGFCIENDGFCIEHDEFRKGADEPGDRIGLLLD